MAHHFDDQGLATWSLEAEDFKLQVVPERGALITSLVWRGEELLYLDRSTLLDRSKNVRGGIPVLFPLCGPVRDNRYQVRGETFTLPQHGFARQRAFTVGEHGDNFIEMSLSADEQTTLNYPFGFELRLRYRLAERRLWLEADVISHSTQTMPFQFGYHPYFLVGTGKSILWDLPVRSYRDNEHPQRQESPYGGNINLQGNVIDWEFLGVSAPQASFTDGDRRLKIKLGYSAEFPYLVVWSVPGKPFVCLEPWSSPRFGMNDGVSLLKLAPGSTQHTEVWIEPSKTN